VSLVGDALRKARQEAAERDSERRGMLFSARISDSPRQSQLGLGLAIGAVIAVAATIGGGVAVLWFLDRGAPPDPPAPAAAIESTGVVLDPTETDAIDEGRAAETAASIKQPEVEREQHAISPAPETTTEEAEAPDLESAPSDEVSDPPRARWKPAAQKRSEGFTGIVDGEEIYILEADLGTVVLSLDFIVFRTDDSFAEINGVELHVGGMVEGFRVKAIERDRVHLTDGRRNIVLRTP